MAEGIDNSKTMGVFVTARYISKASGRGENGADDNCKFEVFPAHQPSQKAGITSALLLFWCILGHARRISTSLA
jgi:hypothetical protein